MADSAFSLESLPTELLANTFQWSPAGNRAALISNYLPVVKKLKEINAVDLQQTTTILDQVSGPYGLCSALPSPVKAPLYHLLQVLESEMKEEPFGDYSCMYHV